MIEKSRLDELTNELHNLEYRAVENLIEMGNRLIEARGILKPDGKWNEWLNREFGWSTRTAYNIISVARAAHKYPQLHDFRSKSVLYLIASSPDPEELMNELQNEGKISYNQAKEIADVHKWKAEIEELITVDAGTAFYEIQLALDKPMLKESAKEMLTKNKEMFAILSARDPDELLAEAGITFEERHSTTPVSKAAARLYEDANNGSLVVWTGEGVSQAHKIVTFHKVKDPEAMAWRSTCIKACVEVTGAEVMKRRDRC